MSLVIVQGTKTVTEQCTICQEMFDCTLNNPPPDQFTHSGEVQFTHKGGEQHGFHSHCIVQWFEMQEAHNQPTTCPHDRTVLNRHSLYLSIGYFAIRILANIGEFLLERDLIRLSRVDKLLWRQGAAIFNPSAIDFIERKDYQNLVVCAQKASGIRAVVLSRSIPNLDSKIQALLNLIRRNDVPIEAVLEIIRNNFSDEDSQNMMLERLTRTTDLSIEKIFKIARGIPNDSLRNTMLYALACAHRKDDVLSHEQILEIANSITDNNLRNGVLFDRADRDDVSYEQVLELTASITNQDEADEALSNFAQKKAADLYSKQVSTIAQLILNDDLRDEMLDKLRSKKGS